MTLSVEEILAEATRWINACGSFRQQMAVIPDSLEEHEYCYSLVWCLKGEEDGSKPRTPSVGAGPLMISKDGIHVDLMGSAPHIDWLYFFELKVRGLVEEWYLEIPFDKSKLSAFKAAMQCNTPELLKRVNEEGLVVFSALKGITDYSAPFAQIAHDLNASGVSCEVQIRLIQQEGGQPLWY